ncbi:hypothetical protein BKA69DRAFT_1126186 [Paraphysoderma sedebokerense]|nr:hypothetical protein BKA69DRAFT_1126186 [Paraphysoderma sedebokerense]
MQVTQLYNIIHKAFIANFIFIVLVSAEFNVVSITSKSNQNRPNTNNQIISYSTISESVWDLKNEVEVTVGTGPDILERVDFFGMDLYLVNPTKHAPGYVKHSHVGKMLNPWLKAEERSIEPNTDYTIKFKPPSFLRSGKYRMIIAVAGEIEDYNYDTIIQAKSSVSIDITIQSTYQPDSALSLDPATKPVPKTETLKEHDIVVVQKLLPRFTSPTDVCNYCASSRSMMTICDHVLRLPYPQSLELPRTTSFYTNFYLNQFQNGGVQQSLTTQNICRLGSIDIALQQLEFKYNSLQVLPSSIPSGPIDLLRSNVKHLKLPSAMTSADEILYWSHPHLDVLFQIHYAQRYNNIKHIIKETYKSVFNVPQFRTFNGDEAIDLNQLEQSIRSLLSYPRSDDFKRKMAKTIRLEIETNGDYICLSRADPFL